MTATHAIWLVAIVTAAGIGADHLLDVEPGLREARELAGRDATLALQTRLGEARFCYDSTLGLIIVEATNRGIVPIDTGNLSLVVDGELRSSWTVDVEGTVGAADWRPGEHAYLNLSDAVEPDRVVIQTREGATIYPPKTYCPVLTTIVVSPAAPTVLTSATQAFTATGYDQYGVPMSGITFTWEASRGSITQGGSFTAPTTVGAATVYANASGVSGSAGVTVAANVNVLSMQTYNNGVASTNFARGDTVEVRVTIRDQAGNLVPAANVWAEYTYPPGSTLDYNGTDATDASGIANIFYTLPVNAKKDTWTITTTLVSGTDLTYVPGSNAQTSTTFVVN